MILILRPCRSGLELLHHLVKLSLIKGPSVLRDIVDVVKLSLGTGVQGLGGRLSSLWRGTLVGRSHEGIHHGLRRGSEVATRFVNLA